MLGKKKQKWSFPCSSVRIVRVTKAQKKKKGARNKTKNDRRDKNGVKKRLTHYQPFKARGGEWGRGRPAKDGPLKLLHTVPA